MTDEGRAAEGTMDWDDAAERTLRAFTEMVPATVRSLAESAARDESELAATDRGAASVAAEDVVRGWIRTTPPDQRNGLVEVIYELGFEAELFEEDLRSAVGWDEKE